MSDTRYLLALLGSPGNYAWVEVKVRLSELKRVVRTAADLARENITVQRMDISIHARLRQLDDADYNPQRQSWRVTPSPLPEKEGGGSVLTQGLVFSNGRVCVYMDEYTSGWLKLPREGQWDADSYVQVEEDTYLYLRAGIVEPTQRRYVEARVNTTLLVAQYRLLQQWQDRGLRCLRVRMDDVRVLDLPSEADVSCGWSRMSHEAPSRRSNFGVRVEMDITTQGLRLLLWDGQSERLPFPPREPDEADEEEEEP